MALKQITAKDFKDAVSSLTNGYTCWHKLLGRTDAGTELVFVIGWSDAGYDEDDAKQNGYADGRYTICSKIACQSRYNGSQSDYDGDFEMPYDKETGDVWDTDTMVSNNESDWETDAATYNKDAQAIWDTYCVPDEDGFTALDALFESKKSSEAKKHTCSMQKKKESLAKKKSESDYGAFDWTVGVSYLENGTGEAVKDVYLIKAHNMNSAKEQAILRANRKGSDAHVYSCKLGKHIYGEAKKPTCSMQKKKESASKKNESSLSHFVVSNAETALDTVCDEILSHTNDDFVINDADAAEIVGKYAIMRELDGFGGYSGTADEFAEWVDGVLSGSPLDGSPFGSAEATEYARKIWSEED